MSDESLKVEIQKMLVELSKDRGLDPTGLVFIYTATGEQIIGDEIVADASMQSWRFLVKRPKRLVRLQRADQRTNAIVTTYIIIDMDLFEEESSIFVQATMWYRWDNMSIQTKHSMLGLLLDYFKMRTMEKAAAAGIVQPGRNLQIKR